ncbi:MAG: alpha-glucan family phosphorylase [Candidatus Omnitrophica bacterium]|nr:alpha-glucan family phosphorylase [Candidatus Omnitrophota bacterium]MDD5573812.1 alpha-glucan family phosphorylase [Candidatus Omnitrophota bacterium]
MNPNNTPLRQYVNIKDYDSRYAADIRDDAYFTFPVGPILEAERALLSGQAGTIAYFSMEYGLATSIYNVYGSARPVSDDNKMTENEVFSNERIPDYLFSLKVDALVDLPIYSGGLGVLAGDTVKTAADMKLPMVAIGILWSKGYFKQRFWFKFGQLPEEMKWDPETFPGLIPLEEKVKLELKNKVIYLRLWKYYVFSRTRDHVVPLVLLDSNVEENDEAGRRLTDKLYRSDDVSGRILQRLILGMGGIRALAALKYPVRIHHLNEGHAAFAFVRKAGDTPGADLEALKSQFAYTCHTPVPAGHDRFSVGECETYLESQDMALVKTFGLEDAKSTVVNLTILAMNTSSSINAVSWKHGEVMKLQFPDYQDRIKAITNGVHFPTWVSAPILKVLDAFAKQMGDYRRDPELLKNVLSLKEDQAFRKGLWQAHQENKKVLASLLSRWRFKEDALTVVWARRIAAYKRPSLLLQDIERLMDIARRIGPLQVLFAGKAHPNDNMAFTYVNEIMNTIDKTQTSGGLLKIMILENYDIYIAKALVSCVDIWLNNPLPPYEASGTSGMKAIANAVPQLSTVDGWVVEAKDSGIGKFFGYEDDGRGYTDGLTLRLNEDARALYAALEEMARLYYDTQKNGEINTQSAWIDMMIHCLAAAGRFNTFRMLNEYRSKVWGMK